ncbi:AMP-binding protein [Rhodococcus triatomae]|uniref:Long-chain-fatty-acid--[acyl-carrier-protein] ligase n=1 Tax=Rhodococcus triatomae TaxID=300028 RepID=A0A1G8NFT2_9NOCA|nr:AMP-binding protein [Rhodococcus triatomae]QNG19995.1 AMP-binding protein [Rhodococcus triatomae]QNG24090.1 AMP-binding protein [Rhodococcus triatomae]SDI78992.1 long-chain-fatty-acid--[acyl-carrier-protein] ligase [Rhodococcus triatomae]
MPDTGVASRTDLVSEISAAMDTGRTLGVLDKADGSWIRRPWSDVYLRAEAYAARLLDPRSGSPTAPVAVVGEPTAETVSVLCGAWLAGRAVTVLAGPVRTATPEAWVRRTLDQFETLGVTAAFSSGTPLGLLREADTVGEVFDLAEVSRWPGAPSSFRPVPAAEDATVLYQGTAGSTGNAKTVQLTASAVTANIRALQQRVALDGSRDSLATWLPLYHDMGLSMLLAGLLSGTQTWLSPTSCFARSPFDWLDWLTVSEATITAAPNFAYSLLGRYASGAAKADLGALRHAINGGEPIDVESTERFARELSRFGFDPRAVACAYGLAEVTCAVTMPLPSSGLETDTVTAKDGRERRHALLGPALDGVRLRIAETRQSTEFDGVRSVGEVEVSSPAQMKGYLGEPDLVPGGWVKTGDLGYLVDDQLVVCGRSKELITLAGRNIFPQDVEAAAARADGVRTGCVVAFADDSVLSTSSGGGAARRDRLVVVAEYVGSDHAAARREIGELVASECAVTPGAVELVGAGTLPKTTSGKLRRLEVKSRFGASAGDPAHGGGVRR